MYAINHTDFKKDLSELIEKVNTDKTSILITGQNSKHAVLMSLEEYNSYKETLHLLGSAKNAERLGRSIADAKAGRLTVHEVLLDNSESASNVKTHI